MLIACVPACVRSYSYKGATKKKQIKTKKIVFFACVFKKSIIFGLSLTLKQIKKWKFQAFN